MRRIKRFNELFDSEEMKMIHEIEVMRSGLTKSKVNYFSEEDMGNFMGKIEYAFPFLDKLKVYPSNDSPNIVYYHGSNDYWYVSLAFSMEGKGEYGLGILYKHVDAIAPKTGNDENFKKTLTFSGQKYTYFVEFDKLSFENLVKKVKDNFVPLIKRLGFDILIEHDKEVEKGRFN